MVLGTVSSTTRISRRRRRCCWGVCPRAGLLYFGGIISLSSLLCASGRIVVNCTSESNPTVFGDVPSGASLGPPIPPDFRGFLSLSEPRDACSPIRLTPHHSIYMGDSALNKVAALVERSHPDAKHRCTFEDKVLNAQKAGVNAVIIFDYPRKGFVAPRHIFHMSGTSNSTNEITIPSVMVSNIAGHKLEDMVVTSRIVEISIDDKDPYHKISTSYRYIPYIAWLTALLLVGLLLGTIVLCLSNSQALLRYERIGSDNLLPPLSKSQLCNFAESTVESELINSCEPNEGCCAICLTDFEMGDRIRTLPCRHFFHSFCIDEWLTSNTRTCPMCKINIESFDGNNRTWKSWRWWLPKNVP